MCHHTDMWKFKVLAAFMMLPSVALASGASAPRLFQGRAYPVNSPVDCMSQLPKATYHNGLYRYGKYETKRPLKISSCWRGTIGNAPFVVVGYSNANAEAAVTVSYRGNSRFVPLMAGTPVVFGFHETSVCLTANFAKGIYYGIDIKTLHLIPEDRLQQQCQLSSLAKSNPEFVMGLKTHHKLLAGVIRYY